MATKIPQRLGEGFAGNDRFSSNKVNMSDMMNQIADSLAAIQTTLDELIAIGTDVGVIDIDTLKTALAGLTAFSAGLEKSDDSRI